MMAQFLLSGGFHNSPDVIIFIKGSRPPTEPISDFLARKMSEEQQKKLEEHFCGIASCSCGSWTRAAMEEL